MMLGVVELLAADAVATLPAPASELALELPLKGNAPFRTCTASLSVAETAAPACGVTVVVFSIKTGESDAGEPLTTYQIELPGGRLTVSSMFEPGALLDNVAPVPNS